MFTGVDLMRDEDLFFDQSLNGRVGKHREDGPEKLLECVACVARSRHSLSAQVRVWLNAATSVYRHTQTHVGNISFYYKVTIVYIYTYLDT